MTSSNNGVEVATMAKFRQYGQKLPFTKHNGWFHKSQNQRCDIMFTANVCGFSSTVDL